ncbi:MAG: WecB/TagA/CpsF family glycosyltransferase [Chloroflexi bacterium]|nr:WecB/TagA/CpsF family glycosyltransferase [Chloroflexota bacterium]
MIEEGAANPDRINILGVNVHCVDAGRILRQALCWAREPRQRSIYYVNAHCLNIARKDREYCEILNHGDLLYADGISVVWASRFLGSRCSIKKATGADWIYDFCRIAEAERLGMYIIAGKPGIARKACGRLAAQFPGLRVVGAADGFFSEKSESGVLEEITRLKPEIVFIGRGTPLQEKWVSAHRSEIDAPVCWTVGALFDYVAGEEARVPPRMNALGLEWLWRLAMDPRGKWRRYLIGNFVFGYYLVQQKLGILPHTDPFEGSDG